MQKNTQADSIAPNLSNPFGAYYIGSANVLPVTIPINNKEVTIPYEMLERRETNATNFVKKTQENNITVARSVLRSAVLSFLQFEKSFKSLLSKGEDSTQLYIIRKCIKELEQANTPFNKIIEDSNLAWLVTYEDPRCSRRFSFSFCCCYCCCCCCCCCCCYFLFIFIEDTSF
jgi:hypothetical protein